MKSTTMIPRVVHQDYEDDAFEDNFDENRGDEYEYYDEWEEVLEPTNEYGEEEW